MVSCYQCTHGIWLSQKLRDAAAHGSEMPFTPCCIVTLTEPVCHTGHATLSYTEPVCHTGYATLSHRTCLSHMLRDTVIHRTYLSKRLRDTVIHRTCLSHRFCDTVIHRTCLSQFCSVQFQVVSMRSEKPICAPPRLSEVSPTLPFKHLQCHTGCVTLSHTEPVCHKGCATPSRTEHGCYSGLVTPSDTDDGPRGSHLCHAITH